MDIYHKIVECTEKESIKQNDRYFYVIFNELDKVFDLKPIMERYRTNPASFIKLILCDPYFDELRPILLSLFKKYGINTSALLWSYVNLLYLPTAPESVVNSIASELDKVPYWSDFTFSDYDLSVNTERGTLHMSGINKWLVSNLSVFMTHNKFHNRCHEAVWNVGPDFTGYTAMTVKMPVVFGGGSYYHSVLERDGTVLDFATNAVVTDGSFMSVVNPEVVFSCPTEELDERYAALKDRDSEVPDNLNAILALAIDAERRR